MQDPRWTSVPKKQIATVDLSKLGEQNFGFGEYIPTAAKEVLVYVNLQVGNSNPHDVRDDIKIFTKDGANEYAQYMAIHTYNQNAWVTNSNNMWFPVTEVREVGVHMPKSFKDNVGLTISVIGYRWTTLGAYHSVQQSIC